MTRRPTASAPPASLLAFLLLAVPAPAAHAAWPHPLASNLPVCTESATQTNEAVVSDGAGGAIFAWTDARSGPFDVYAQRVDLYGRRLWTATGAPVCTAAGNQDQVSMAPDGAGGAWIAWRDARSGGQDIYETHLDANGVVSIPNGAAVCTATGNQSEPRITPSLSGTAVVAWQDVRSGNFDLYIQRMDATGNPVWTPNGNAVGSGAGDQTFPVTAFNPSSGVVCVAWQDTRSGSSEVFAQLISTNGNAVWTANGVRLSAAAGAETAPAVVLVGGSDFIVGWSDTRSGVAQIYAQKLNSLGSAAWPPDGVALAPAAGHQLLLRMVSDGLGAAMAVWQDYRDPLAAIYAQKVNTQGTPTWTTDGVPIVTGWGSALGGVASDNLGGVLVSWIDARFGTDDVFAQRLNGFGAEQWSSGGQWVSIDENAAARAAVAPDLGGGAILSWDETPFGTPDIFAKRVDRWGYLGAEPVIATVTDVPDDQGGQVKLSWYASPLETDPFFDGVVTSYYVFRSVPLGLALERLRAGVPLVAPERAAPRGGPSLTRIDVAGVTAFWEAVGFHGAFQLPSYSLVVPTTGDSVAGSNRITLFMVQARSGNAWWPSAPDSGYSVDDLAPAAPSPFTGLYSSGVTLLDWDPNLEPDLAEYRLYRGTGASFVPGPSNRIATLHETGFADNAGAPYHYKLSAMDVHGNESVFATLKPQGTTDAPGASARAELALAPVSPNPVRGVTWARYFLPAATRVSLCVFDASGRRLRRLVAGPEPAGEHFARWDGRDESGAGAASGRYFLRLEAAGRVLNRGFVLLR